MANYRPVHTKFWSDHKVELLSKEAKLLFLYLMTNPLRTSSGLYQITRNRAARDCSMTEEEAEGALAELAVADLVLYDDEASVVLVINAVKYLQRTKEMRRSVINDLVYNDTPLADDLLKRHSHIKQWEEWTDEDRCIVDSRNSKKEWEDDGVPF
jgi:hypothetical protein